MAEGLAAPDGELTQKKAEVSTKARLAELEEALGGLSESPNIASILANQDYLTNSGLVVAHTHAVVPPPFTVATVPGASYSVPPETRLDIIEASILDIPQFNRIRLGSNPRTAVSISSGALWIEFQVGTLEASNMWSNGYNSVYNSGWISSQSVLGGEGTLLTFRISLYNSGLPASGSVARDGFILQTKLVP